MFSENAGRQTRGQYHVWDTLMKLWLRMTQRSLKQYKLFSVLLVDHQNFMALCSLALFLLLVHPLLFSLLHSLSLMVRALAGDSTPHTLVKEYREIKLILTANLSPCWLALIVLEDAIYAGVSVKCYPLLPIYEAYELQ